MNQYTAQCLACNRYSKILIKRRKKKKRRKEGREGGDEGGREGERETMPSGKNGLISLQ